ncbi:MAG: hypothetical protein KC561_17160, partial [Myxococcales bacterium]|nr:hypothetical protein [Myxococcales bacterium]
MSRCRGLFVLLTLSQIACSAEPASQTATGAGGPSSDSGNSAEIDTWEGSTTSNVDIADGADDGDGNGELTHGEDIPPTDATERADMSLDRDDRDSSSG